VYACFLGEVDTPARAPLNPGSSSDTGRKLRQTPHDGTVVGYAWVICAFV